MTDMTIVSGPYRFVHVGTLEGLGETLWYVYKGMTLTYVGQVWLSSDGSFDWDLPDDVSQLLADSPDADRIKDAIRDYSV